MKAIVIVIILLGALILSGCMSKEERAKQEILESINNDNNLSESEKALAEDMVEKLSEPTEPIKKLSTESFKNNEIIKFNDLELTIKSFEYTEDTGEYYSEKTPAYILVYEIKNNKEDSIYTCSFDFNYVDPKGSQVSGLCMFCDGYEIMPNAKEEFEVTFRSESNEGTNGILYMSPFQCDEACQKMRSLMGTEGVDSDNICPDFKIKVSLS